MFLGSFTFKFFNLWAILFGSVAMDIEPLILLFNNPCYACPHHGFLHSVLGAIIGSLVVAAILWFFRKELNKISLKFRIQQPFSFKVLFFSSLIAWLIHIFFDSLTHFDVLLFWPFLKENPILIGPQIYWPLNLILLILGITGLLLLIKKIGSENQRTD